MFLLLAIQGSLKAGIDVGKWPLLNGILNECWKVEAFWRGGLDGYGRFVSWDFHLNVQVKE